MTDEELKEQLETELSELNSAISAIRKAGQGYMITSGGSTRQVTMADYDKLLAHRSEVRRQIKELDGEAGMVLGVGW